MDKSNESTAPLSDDERIALMEKVKRLLDGGIRLSSLSDDEKAAVKRMGAERKAERLAAIDALTAEERTPAVDAMLAALGDIEQRFFHSGLTVAQIGYAIFLLNGYLHDEALRYRSEEWPNCCALPLGAQWMGSKPHRVGRWKGFPAP